jgi:TetR/AcrR family transcriptional repressor of lmrAB and yxaGH operons
MSKLRSKGEETRARMLEAAAKLFRKHGYNGTGLSQIIKESGTPKGSLYFHFPDGKVELTTAALLEAGREFSSTLRELMSPEMEPAEAIEVACSALAKELVDSDFEHGCPIATVALEASSHSEPIRLACAEHFQDWQELIESMLTRRAVPEDQAREVAVTALATIEGALLLSRVRRSVEPLAQVGRQMRMILACVLAESES